MDPLNKIELAESLTHTLKEMTILNVNSLTVCCLMIYMLSNDMYVRIMYCNMYTHSFPCLFSLNVIIIRVFP